MDENENNFIEMMFLDDNPMNYNAILHIENHLAEPIVEEEIREVEVVRNFNYYENVVPNYSGIQLKEHFRMYRATFHNLMNVIHKNYPQQQNPVIPLQKKTFILNMAVGQTRQFF